MRPFNVCIIAGFILSFTVYLPSSAQKCSVKIIGTSCGEDTLNGKDSLQAVFSGGSLSTLAWTWDGDKYDSGGVVFYSTANANFFAAKPGGYKVIATSKSGCIDTSKTITVIKPSFISGLSAITPGEGVIYAVHSDPDHNYPDLSYIWSVPDDATITSGQGTSEIYVTWGTKSGYVTAKSGCMNLRFYVRVTDTLICYDQSVPKISFKGRAPSPWAINGKVDDWKTILGPYTGQNNMPYYPPNSSGFNWSRDGKINREPNFAILPEYDSPTPDRDIIFNAFTNDDYNVYFYFRRLNSKNSTNSFYYFCDIDADGFMRLGEPVFYGSFDSSNILSLSVGTFVPDTTLKPVPNNPFSTPYVPGKGDDMSWVLELYGYHMPGKVKELFNWKNIPLFFKPKTNEIFSAAVTENGYGVEFAIPWRYFRDSISIKTGLTSKDVFAYRISLLKGNTDYDTAKVADDANNCCGSLAVSDNPKVTNKVSVIEIDSSLSYRFNLTYFNPTNATERVSIEDVLLSNLHYTSNQKPLLRNINLRVSSDSDCDDKFDNFQYGAFNEGGDMQFNFTQPNDTTTIDFEDSLNFSTGSAYGPAIHIPPYQKGCFVVHLKVPPKMSLVNSNIEFNGSVRHWLHEIYDRCQDGGGGRTINPVGKAKTKIGGNGLTAYSFSDKSIGHGLNDSEVKIYPNPNNGSFIVSLPSGETNVEVKLWDVLARNIQQWHQFNSDMVKVNNLRSGVYFLNVRFKNGKTITKTVVVE